MDYQAIRAALIAYFSMHLAQVKEHLQKTGPFSKDFRESYVQKREQATLALEKGYYNVYANDDELIGALRACQLPISKGTPEFRRFTEEYLKAYHDTCDEALEINERFEKYANELAIDVKNMLLRLHKRYKMVPVLRDLSLREVLEKTGYPLLSPSSVNQYNNAFVSVASTTSTPVIPLSPSSFKYINAF